jgi:hypothetical protein
MLLITKQPSDTKRYYRQNSYFESMLTVLTNNRLLAQGGCISEAIGVVPDKMLQLQVEDRGENYLGLVSGLN